MSQESSSTHQTSLSETTNYAPYFGSPSKTKNLDKVGLLSQFQSHPTGSLISQFNNIPVPYWISSIPANQLNRLLLSSEQNLGGLTQFLPSTLARLQTSSQKINVPEPVAPVSPALSESTAAMNAISYETIATSKLLPLPNELKHFLDEEASSQKKPRFNSIEVPESLHASLYREIFKPPQVHLRHSTFTTDSNSIFS